jgi:hypothetical protein
MMTQLAARERMPAARHPWIGWVCGLVAGAGMLGAGLIITGDFARTVLTGAVVLALAVVTLSSPVIAAVALLGAMFLRVALTGMFPEDPFVVAFALTALSYWMWTRRTVDRLRGVGRVELAMGLFFLWNVYSMLAQHKYTAEAHLTNWSSAPIEMPAGSARRVRSKTGSTRSRRPSGPPKRNRWPAGASADSRR